MFTSGNYVNQAGDKDLMVVMHVCDDDVIVTFSNTNKNRTLKNFNPAQPFRPSLEHADGAVVALPEPARLLRKMAPATAPSAAQVVARLREL
jgi:hypothetical protein